MNQVVQKNKSLPNFIFLDSEVQRSCLDAPVKMGIRHSEAFSRFAQPEPLTKAEVRPEKIRARQSG